MPEYTVTSEIYGEYDYKTGMKPSREGNVISEFPFLLPKGNDKAQFDEDSDLDIERPQRNVIKIDIDLGGILELIKLNAKYNSKLIKSQFKVMPLDFTSTDWNVSLLDEIKRTDVIIAADVIYDDDVTAAFISTIQKILNTNPPKTIYIVLEKRYVFTIEHMDSVAPCYETFLALLDKVKIHSNWIVEQLPTDFPKYFTYDRVKDLVLWKITSKEISC
ncbi:jg19618 [Pararge aegeria aegeria]|uniref:Jg19618 protein n=1 Tax=Pararge aegeria aegeria TaxID=348720 RepID=A0A8S4S6I7_9NEOP|nr:jg19618 [Pararge aegeria aegeria]